jgi:ferrochelatase
MSRKMAVVLFNLGGPDSPEAVEPFLRNLFCDPAILRVPGFLRNFLARTIARRRAPVARDIYARIGGASPILANTKAQGAALEAALAARRPQAAWRCFIAMRYWHPFVEEARREIEAWGPDEIVLLPLYPQFSTTTTASSMRSWRVAGAAPAPTREVCCYPWLDGFVEAMADIALQTIGRVPAGMAYRVLFSAHGLPEKIVKAGDPYQWQVEQSVAQIAERLGPAAADRAVCYQSRVGPLKWIGPSTDSEIERAGRDGKAVVLVPVAFVSEHSETLVELDIEYRHLAAEKRVPAFLRAPTVSTHPAFIEGLAGLVLEAAGAPAGARCVPGSCTAPLCPDRFAKACAMRARR